MLPSLKPRQTIYSKKSTLLFPYWVQWFTDGFLRTDRNNRLRNTSNYYIDLAPVYGLTRKMTHQLRSFEGGKLKSQQIDNEEYPRFFMKMLRLEQLKRSSRISTFR